MSASRGKGKGKRSTFPSLENFGFNKRVRSEEKTTATEGEKVGEAAPEDSAAHDNNASEVNSTLSETDLLKLPVLFDGEFFLVVKKDGDKIEAKCSHCPAIVKGCTTSTGNFRKHVKIHHPKLLDKLNEKRAEGAPSSSNSGDGRGRSGSGFHPVLLQRQANESIVNYIVGAMRPISTVEHPDFKNLIEVISRGEVSCPTRKGVQELINAKYDKMIAKIKAVFQEMKYVCVTADIWSARRKSYLGMVALFIDKKTLERRSYTLAIRRFKFSHTYDKIAELIFSVLTEYGLVGKVTDAVTDGASNFGKAFRVFGKYDSPPQPTPTSKSANTPEDEAENKENESGSDDDDDKSGGNSSDSDAGLADSENNENAVIAGSKRELGLDGEESFVPVNVDEVTPLSIDFQSCTVCGDAKAITLPSQKSCACHKLSLVATSDVSKIDDPAYLKISKSSFGKVRKVWNKSSRSTKASDNIEKVLNGKLPTPNATRWNAEFDCTKALVEPEKEKEGGSKDIPVAERDKRLKVAREKRKDKINEVMSVLGLRKLKTSEFEFLTEWVLTVQPLAVTLDFLQGQEICFLGSLLPALRALSKSLKRLDGNLKYCQPLRNAIAEGVMKRFHSVLVDLESEDFKEHAVATMSLPRFKLGSWAPRELKDRLRKMFVEECKSVFDRLEAEKATKIPEKEKIPAMTAKESDFFSVLSSDDEDDENSRTNCNSNVAGDSPAHPNLVGEAFRAEAELEAIRYLSDARTDVSMLHDYPIVKEVFLTYNTTVPSSASVERFFSTGKLTFVPQRNKLGDGTFEKLMLLKTNKDC